MEDYILFDDLVNALTEIINEVRLSDNVYDNLIKSIQQLELNYSQLSKDKEMLFGAYKAIQDISMQLRKLLVQFGIKVKQYDNINYSFYYTNSNGQTIRYSTDKLNINWLRVSETSGELQINLTKAINDISKDGLNNMISILFTDHYQSYYNLITGTYNPRKKYKNKFYKRAPLNKGHISEAFEEHLSEHHPGFYQLLNSNAFYGGIEDNNSVLSKMYEMELKTDKWHESVTQAWLHVRHSMGTQRGTVAGDVGKFQVKSGSSQNPKLRLARFNTLKDGVKAYSLILNKEKDSKEVATLIASYMSERINKTSERLVDAIIDKEASTLLKSFDSQIGKDIIINI